MKSPLRYQATRYDCGTTSFVNALMFLFERDEIPPKVVRYATEVTCDRHLDIAGGMGGTSFAALAFLAAWLNDYSAMTGMPVRCETLRDEEVTMHRGSRLERCLLEGGAVVASCCLGADHYVLLTGMDGDRVRLFDPYYDTWPLHELDVPVVGVSPVWDEPHSCNRLVERWVLDEPAGVPYSLQAKSGRDATLLYHT